MRCRAFTTAVSIVLVLLVGCLQPVWAQKDAGMPEANASQSLDQSLEGQVESQASQTANATLQQEIARMTVAEMNFCYDVQNRQPVGINDTFPDTVGSVYCFTRITGAEGEASVQHIWYYEQEVARVDLRVASPDWRTWSSKRILESQDGWWTVDVVDGQGNVLASKDFFISQTAQ